MIYLFSLINIVFIILSSFSFYRICSYENVDINFFDLFVMVVSFTVIFLVNIAIIWAMVKKNRELKELKRKNKDMLLSLDNK